MLTKMKTTLIILAAALLLSVIYMTWTFSSMTSSWLVSFTQRDDYYLSPQNEQSVTYGRSSVVTTSAVVEEHRGARKSVINRGKTSTLGLHVCTCLRDDHPSNTNLPHTSPKRLRWLHFPKTGTSFFSTLWSYSCSTRDRYIDLNVNSQVCQGGVNYSMFDYALMRRYPWEMYGAPHFIPDDSSRNGKDIALGLVGGTQHLPLSPNLNDKHFLQSDRYKKLVSKNKLSRFGSEVMTHNMTVVAFFRQPEERIISAYKDSYHSAGFVASDFKDLVTKVRGSKKKLCKSKTGNRTYEDPVQCFANQPGIAGCMARMLTGQTCADGLFREAGLENIADAVDIILNHLEFVGLTEDWNESICQFHRLFSGRKSDSGKRVWNQPSQREFANVHKSSKATIGVESLDGFKDVADTVVYEAAKLKFERMVGDERCYKFISWDEIEEEINSNNHVNTPFFNMDKDGNACHPLACSDLGKQCGEWDDGCGSKVICGLCDTGRSGLPSTWRVQCKEGKCIDYCPPWEKKGLWFLSEDSPPIMKNLVDSIETREQKYLSPIEAIKICDLACQGKAGNASTNDGIESFIDMNLCQCGNTPTKVLQNNITISDFSSAHDMTASCNDNKALKSLKFLNHSDSQPICCPYMNETTLLQSNGKGWKKLFQMGGPNLEGYYFAHIPMECGGLDECKHMALERGAEMAVFDIMNSYCHLAKNVFDLIDSFPVAKDNNRRYIFDLRGLKEGNTTSI